MHHFSVCPSARRLVDSDTDNRIYTEVNNQQDSKALPRMVHDTHLAVSDDTARKGEHRTRLEPANLIGID